MKPRSVLLADDHVLLREGIAALIAQHPTFKVIGCTGDGRDCVRIALREQPDLVIFDCSMPGLSGIEAARRIAAHDEQTKLICVSMHEEPHWVRSAFDAGAHGYVLKRCAFADLIEAMETVLSSRYYVSRDVAHVLVDTCRTRVRPKVMDGIELSTREREITQLFSEGYSTRDIAERLHVSVKTVGTHREHIMLKLGLHGIAQLTRYALREGLTTLDI
ncbi:response regulator transcription factor [Rhodanobacter sp. MP1X3]|uniref:response regulator n=1 Tax=Rhodanobacter sp. MP1X3 TaxID=2723086 RepID=UPI00161E9A0A|nr:response regulator transcription factor [Rhodanobacter sp. MP1X3]MBB6244356.1 DNA-binding NarL/FixJ family response regulator [Rhodanobacter sp. MP1X3]